MTECIAQLRLSFYQPKPVEVRFDAPEITSNGGRSCCDRSTTNRD